LRGPSGISTAPSRAFARVPPNPALSSLPGKPLARSPVKLPAALAFLSAYGVDSGLLHSAAEEACRQAVAPEAVLLASGTVRESVFYRCLAHYLYASAEDRLARNDLCVRIEAAPSLATGR
jgi:hypothetical protein